MPRSIRLVSFNILEGFRPSSASSSERRLIDRDRAAAARAVVADLAPDILVLNEALFCRQYAGRLSTMDPCSTSRFSQLHSMTMHGAMPF